MTHHKGIRRHARPRKKRERDIKDSVLVDIQNLVSIQNASGPAILRYLEGQVEIGELQPKDVPSLRTIQRVIKDLRIPDEKEIWHLADGGGEDGQLILPILAEILLQTQGRVHSLTKTLAKWVLNVRKAAPDAPAYRVWQLALIYMNSEAKGLSDTSDLDNYIAFAPWKSRNHLDHYLQAIEMGWIKKWRGEAWLGLCPVNLGAGALTILDAGLSPRELLVKLVTWEVGDRGLSSEVSDVARDYLMGDISEEEFSHFARKVDRMWAGTEAQVRSAVAYLNELGLDSKRLAQIMSDPDEFDKERRSRDHDLKFEEAVMTMISAFRLDAAGIAREVNKEIVTEETADRLRHRLLGLGLSDRQTDMIVEKVITDMREEK
jgi:hypothetical protein